MDTVCDTASESVTMSVVRPEAYINMTVCTWSVSNMARVMRSRHALGFKGASVSETSSCGVTLSSL